MINLQLQEQVMSGTLIIEQHEMLSFAALALQIKYGNYSKDKENIE